jgi:serine O-acetyltransferase
MPLWSRLKEDVLIAFERDPAARSVLEVVLCYPGVHALVLHRIAHSMWIRGGHLPARLLAHVARFLTGVEIHPGATVGRRCFIDHGMGVVIGETAEIGADVLIYQGVSLGGTSLTKGKRHPTIEDYVVVGLGATVLGPVTVGRHSRVGAGSVVVSSVPAHSTVVGVPARVVGEAGEHTAEGHPLVTLDHASLPDPLLKALSTLSDELRRLEAEVASFRDSKNSAEASREGTTSEKKGAVTSAAPGGSPAEDELPPAPR